MGPRTERLELRLDEEALGRIDEWRGDQPDVPNRSEAVRRLVTAGLENPEGQQLFQLARFQVLCAAKMKGPDEALSDGYVFAWEHGVYPLFDEEAEMQRPFAQNFLIPPDKIEELSKFLDALWLEKEEISFYGLEKHYEIREGRGFWDRMKLIHACRYMRLKGLFDDEFWAGILKKTDYPIEASSINSPYPKSASI